MYKGYNIVPIQLCFGIFFYIPGIFGYFPSIADARKEIDTIVE